MTGEERHFVDTNIFVYAYDRGSGQKQKLAKDLVASLWGSRRGCISIQVLQELFVTMTRKASTPSPPETAVQVITALSEWPHHVPVATDILEAIDIQQRYGLSFWDAMIVNSAGKTGCSVLWTEDLKNGQIYGSVTVCNPFEREPGGGLIGVDV